MLDRAPDGVLAAAQPGLADAGDPLVGIDDDEAVALLAVRDEDRLDIGDLHACPREEAPLPADAGVNP